MPTCPTCQTELVPGSQFCPHDGTPVAHLGQAARVLDNRVGLRVAKRYELQDVLGEGGMATVYRARAHALGEDVALKLLHGEITSSRTAVARFAREARAASRIDHPNVVRILDFGFDAEQGFYFLVMELLEGVSLGAVLDQGPLPLISALHVLSQIAAGLARAHELGVIHRDLKPDNVVLVPRGGRDDHAKVVDFGLSRLTESAEPRLTLVGDVIGTPAYMAPEQWKGRAVDEGVDLYAFGALAHHLINGDPPFGAERSVTLMLAHEDEEPPSLSHRGVDVPPPVVEIVRKCLEKDRADRPASFREVLVTLADAWTHISGPPPQLSYVGGPSLRGRLEAPTETDLGVPHFEQAAALSQELERLRRVRRRRLTELAEVVFPNAPPAEVRALILHIERGEAHIAGRAETLALAEAELRAAEERLARGEADLRLQLVNANLAHAGFAELALADTMPPPAIEAAEHALAAHRAHEREELGDLTERLQDAVLALARLEGELAPSYEQLSAYLQDASLSSRGVRPHLEAFASVDRAISALQQRMASMSHG